MPADWVAMVTGDDIVFNREVEGGVNEGMSLWRAGVVVTGGGQIEVKTSTGHCHITGVTAGPDNRQERGIHWI